LSEERGSKVGALDEDRPKMGCKTGKLLRAHSLRCLNDFDLETASYEVIQFDGRYWEEAVAMLNYKIGFP